MKLSPLVSPSILFASCNNPLIPITGGVEKLWRSMKTHNASAFVWGGDAVYGDRLEIQYRNDSIFPKPKRVEATETRLKYLYSHLLSTNPYYPIPSAYHFGTVDDHDFGKNNGDKYFSIKSKSASAFVDFVDQSNAGLNVKEDIGRVRAEAGQGVYGLKVFSYQKNSAPVVYPEEAEGYPSDVPDSNNTVAIFYLDCRSNKDPWPKGFDFLLQKGLGLDMLGETQWNWLEENLKKSNARVNIILNGLQVLSQSRVPNGNLAEDWEKFPDSRNRLLNSVLNSGVRAPILLTGDVHMSQLLRVTCTSLSRNSSSRTLYELTTSGITHSWSTFFSPQAEHRELWYYFYLCFLSRNFMHLSHLVMPWNEINIDSSTGKMDYSIELNYAKFDFGEIEEGRVKAQVITPAGVAIEKIFDLADIDPIPANHDENENDYDCVPYRGEVKVLHLLFGYVITVGFLILFAFLPVFGMIGGGLYLFWRLSVSAMNIMTITIERKKHKFE
ncbi:hypothetical protein TrST_g10798 [Triparma strigata]|uniref:PhoD-like phosphatase metallophosphatase domain-containing protein n=1 Tax=Triparma strigata TaxID=1606541 RepID=A0A9W7C430_9STRA|nr:hypothetical protein TrST_g10798 [Triparma strigata]